MGSQRVRDDRATSLLLFTFMHWRRKWQCTPVFLPGESQGQRSLVGCCLWVHTESDTTEATSSSSSNLHYSLVLSRRITSLCLGHFQCSWTKCDRLEIDTGLSTTEHSPSRRLASFVKEQPHDRDRTTTGHFNPHLPGLTEGLLHRKLPPMTKEKQNDGGSKK